jgi:hypothetical protein
MKVSVFGRQIFKWDEEVGTGQAEIVKEGQYSLPISLKQRQTGTIVFTITSLKA